MRYDLWVKIYNQTHAMKRGSLGQITVSFHIFIHAFISYYIYVLRHDVHNTMGNKETM